MNRIVLVVALFTLIVGLAVVHFSLANAQPALSPASVHPGPEEHTPTPTFTPVMSAMNKARMKWVRISRRPSPVRHPRQAR